VDAGRSAIRCPVTKVFEGKGVHREALAALWLFYEAAERSGERFGERFHPNI
jgi:hypothetical protein